MAHLGPNQKSEPCPGVRGGGSGRIDDNGQVNLLRNLEVLLEVQQQDLVGNSSASSAAADHRRNNDIRRRKGPRGGLRPDPRVLNLNDPDLYQALMEECLKEEKTSPMLEYVAPPLVTNYLVRNGVRPLKKRSTKFPKAQYYCRLCDYHCDTLTICISHIKDERHSRLARMQEIETTLFHLPKPGKQHLEFLEQLLAFTFQEIGLSKEDLELRQTITDKVSAFLGPIIEGSSVRMYGSCLTGTGLKWSSINLDLQISEDVQPHVALITAFQALNKSSHFQNVTQDFGSKMPHIQFSCNGVACELSLNNHHAYQTSAMIRDYVNLDPRVRIVGTAIRYWAKLCLIDRQAEGTMPPHAFTVLLIFFLQQLKKPILPCIHDYLEARDTDTYESPIANLAEWKTENTQTSAELLIEFFKFYALDFRQSETVVSLRYPAGLSKEEKQWKGKKLAIEEPFSPKRNLIRSVNSVSVLDFVLDCFRIGFLYFGTVQTLKGPIITKIRVPDASPERKQQQQQQKGMQQQQQQSAAKAVEDIFKQLNISANDLKEPLPPTAISLEELEQSFDQEEEEEEEDISGETLESFLKRYGRNLTPKQAKIVTELVPKNMIHFEFNGDILTAGHKPELICTVCQNSGHLQNECPDERLPQLVPLPRINKVYEDFLDRMCLDIMGYYEPVREELRDREDFIRDLRNYIKQSLSHAELTVFGSSFNGFAFANSDLDISLTFDNQATAEGLDSIEIIENLAERLKRMNGVKNVQAITSAKVPIIKFSSVKYKSCRIEGDISLYNVLAQRNTQMLRLYSMIDPRVKVLGYMAKLFAKTCDIGDASRGSLSSYAYILMLLYYLQQVQPPVIPVLQELHTPGEKPEVMVDGWNSWFFDDLSKLSKVWDGWQKNRQSSASLWLGFLQFYAQDFDDKNLVICTRQKAVLTKFEKMWNSPCIAIEDPFDLSHNLGAGISRKMNLFIKKAFIKTRNRFGFPPSMMPKDYKTIQSYFWDVRFLTEGAPPNDRGCRICSKIGHLARDCPKKKVADDRKKERAKQRNNLETNKNNKPKQQQQQQQQPKQQQQPFLPQPMVQRPPSQKDKEHMTPPPQMQGMQRISPPNPLLAMLAQAVNHPNSSFGTMQHNSLPPKPISAISVADLEANHLRGSNSMGIREGSQQQQPPPLPKSAMSLAELEKNLTQPPNAMSLAELEKSLTQQPKSAMSLAELEKSLTQPLNSVGGKNPPGLLPPGFPLNLGGGGPSLLPSSLGGIFPSRPEAGQLGPPPPSSIPPPSVDFFSAFQPLPSSLTGMPVSAPLLGGGPPLMRMPMPFGGQKPGPFSEPPRDHQNHGKPLQLNDFPNLNLLPNLMPSLTSNNSSPREFVDNSPQSLMSPATFNSQSATHNLHNSHDQQQGDLSPADRLLSNFQFPEPFQRHWQP